MTEGPRPNLRTRLRALRQGERDAGVLEALRAAGRAAHQEQLLADQARAELTLAGHSVWQASPATQSRLLAAWSATAWQTLGESVLDTVYAVDPRTAGYVPPVTYDLVWRWLNMVEQWLKFARAATIDPRFEITAVLPVPTSLQVGPVATNTPRPHRHAITAAVSTARQLAEAAVYALEIDTPAEYEPKLNRIRALAGQAAVQSDYLVGLHPALDNEDLHHLIDERVRSTLDLWVTIGQTAAMPALLSRRTRSAHAARASRPAGPPAAPPRPQSAPRPAPEPRLSLGPGLPLGSRELPDASVGRGSAVLGLRLTPGISHTVSLIMDGDNPFRVSTRSEQGTELAVLAQAVGAYRGVLPLDLGVVPATLHIDTSADMRWRVTIDRLSNAPRWNGRASGAGSAVLRVPSRLRMGFAELRVSHTGSARFRVIAHTPWPTLLVDGIGPYRGTVALPAGSHTLQIDADGSWSISLPSVLAD
ncbi:hypothetical protein IU474_30915 [Nocardia otitidiscaviarum]|uniref:hypothetical protein n=1 Tax=Nocardia otitidiscaviarum TaxID=1823 RepID=UPI001893E8A8|nr:hypothetical protein [Nocardia otitidiscaviarum]MBF6241456.1 hypothetical protein [Nocardia otitidiscaviarum]